MLDKKDPGLIRTDCARVFCCLSAAGSDATMQRCNYAAMQLCSYAAVGKIIFINFQKVLDIRFPICYNENTGCEGRASIIA